MKSNHKSSRLFDNRIFKAIISLVAALLIWIYITGNQEEEITREFRNIPVVFSGAETMQESQGYVLTDVDTETVTIRVKGTRANIGKLDASELQAVIDLSKVTKTGNNRVSYTISYPSNLDSSKISVISRSPENIQFYVAKQFTKTVPVKGAFSGRTAEGYVAEEPVFEPTTITLTGPDSKLENIAYVWATIGGDNVTETKTADVPFTYMDADGKQLDYTDITPDYDTVTVTVPISLEKEVSLSIDILEGAGATSENTIVTIEPATVMISGDSTIVEGINKIVLTTIDLTDFASTYEETYPIILDNDVQNVTGTAEAKVKIEIVGLETKKMAVTNISLINVPSGYSAELLTQSLEATIRASSDVLSKIKSNNLRAVADLSQIVSTGDVSVPVKIYIDGYSDAGAVGDYKVTVNIK
jgi:YbbR domain-containing protein